MADSQQSKRDAVREPGKNLEDRFPDGMAAIARLFAIAMGDTGQSRRVANFLLAWHNAEENGGWDPTDMWNVDERIADDMLLALIVIRHSFYPDQLGFKVQIGRVWNEWRG